MSPMPRAFYALALLNLALGVVNLTVFAWHSHVASAVSFVVAGWIAGLTYASREPRA